METKIGFIGLGVMGQSMAGQLLAAGHSLHVNTRTPDKAGHLLDRGAVWAENPSAIARQCNVIFTIVGYPQDVEDVYLSPNGLIKHARPGVIMIDMTTSRPDLAVKIAEEAAKQGGLALDAPVSGGDKGAREGTLSIMVGGEKMAYDRLLPLLQLMGEKIVYQGPAGSGQHCKMCNQIAIAANMMGVCEALAYALKAGLNPKTVLQSISTGAAGSWSLENLAPRILKGNFDPGFYVKHFIKDMSIAAESADKLSLQTPGLRLALSLYQQLAEMGYEEEGTQALFRLYTETEKKLNLS